MRTELKSYTYTLTHLHTHIHGMQACLTAPSKNGAPEPIKQGGASQVFNYSKSSGFITQSTTNGPTPGQCLTFVSVTPGSGAQVVLPVHASSCNTSWDVLPVKGDRHGAVTLRIREGSPSGGAGKCLAYTAPVAAPIDEWCIENNNMWRSSTDTLQSWGRTMVEVESMATQGHISRPGACSEKRRWMNPLRTVYCVRIGLGLGLG